MKEYRFLRRDDLWNFLSAYRASEAQAASIVRGLSRTALVDLYNDFVAAQCLLEVALSEGRLREWSDDARADAAQAIIAQGREAVQSVLERGQIPVAEASLKRGNARMLMSESFFERFGSEISGEIDRDYWNK